MGEEFIYRYDENLEVYFASRKDSLLLKKETGYI